MSGQKIKPMARGLVQRTRRSPVREALPGANITWAGLFFCPRPHSHTAMDKSIERIIRRVLEEARAKGRDHLAQTELAVRAVCSTRTAQYSPAARRSSRRSIIAERRDLQAHVR